MTEPPVVASPNDGVRHYTMLCIGSLGVMALALFVRGLDTLSLLPALVGALAMLLRWRTGALGVLMIVVWLLAAQHWPVLHPVFIGQEATWLFYYSGFGGHPPPFVQPALANAYEGFGWADLLLCAATLAYFAGHYRLLSVTQRIFPEDPRRRVKQGTPQERRSPQLVAGREILTLLAPVPLWIALAWLCWRWLERKQTVELDIDDRWWQVMILAWLFGLIFLFAAALLRYASQGRMRPNEAALFLQDTLWRETSREQRRINRWISWARRRQQRREEP
jgi:hypothetical protein